MDENRIYALLDVERKEIRLLVLNAGGKGDKIECSLTTTSLLDSSRPAYETVSYCWGDATQRKDIIIDGRLRDCPLNGHAALSRIRLTDGDRLLWIDSVCIDQSNTQERGQQVSLMAEIYENGACNLVYLGEGNKSAQLALTSVRLMVEDERVEVGDSELIRGLRRKLSKEGIPEGPPLYKVDTMGFSSFFEETPWFR